MEMTLIERLEHIAEQLGQYQVTLKLWPKQQRVLERKGFEVTTISETATRGFYNCIVSWENAQPNTQAGNLRKWADDYHAEAMRCPKGILTNSSK